MNLFGDLTRIPGDLVKDGKRLLAHRESIGDPLMGHLDDLSYMLLTSLKEDLNLFGGFSADFSEAAELLRDHRESTTVLTCSSCLDRGVEGEELGFEDDIVNDRCFGRDLRDDINHLSELRVGLVDRLCR